MEDEQATERLGAGSVYLVRFGSGDAGKLGTSWTGCGVDSSAIATIHHGANGGGMCVDRSQFHHRESSASHHDWMPEAYRQRQEICLGKLAGTFVGWPCPPIPTHRNTSPSSLRCGELLSLLFGNPQHSRAGEARARTSDRVASWYGCIKPRSLRCNNRMLSACCTPTTRIEGLHTWLSGCIAKVNLHLPCEMRGTPGGS